MKKALLFILFPFLSFGQTQIGGDIDGKRVYGPTSASFFGTTISLSNDGNVIAIGDKNFATWSGTVFLYKNIGGAWTDIGNNFPYGGSGDEKGESVSLSSDGTVLAIGSSSGWGSGRDSGFVQVYKNIAGTWTQIGAKINGEFGGDYSGSSVSLSNDGTIVAIGSTGNSQKNFQAGSVRVFQNIAGTWTQIGADIDGKNAADYFGSRVSLSGDGSTVAIGSDKDYVRVYKNIGGTWTLLGNEIEGDYLSLSGDGSTVAVSTYFWTLVYDGKYYDKEYTIYVKVLSIRNGVWTQLGADILIKDGDYYSASLSNDASILAIGVPGRDENGDESGTVRIYKNINGNWTQHGVEIKGEAKYDKNGAFVTLSKDGSALAIGAPYNDGYGTDSGSVRVYNLSAILSSDSFVLANFSVYPNPASEVVNINLAEDLKLEKVNVYNILGQLVKTENKNSIAVNTLDKGAYFFEVITNKGKATKKIIVK